MEKMSKNVSVSLIVFISVSKKSKLLKTNFFYHKNLIFLNNNFVELNFLTKNIFLQNLVLLRPVVLCNLYLYNRADLNKTITESPHCRLAVFRN